MGRHQRGDGRRRAVSRFKVIRMAADAVDLCDTAIEYVSALIHPEFGSFPPLDQPSSLSGISPRRMRLAWGKAIRMASIESLPKEPWPEHRIGMTVSGAKANHFVAARPSSPGPYDILLSSRINPRGHCSLYRDTAQAVLEQATDLGLVRWLPVGIHADAITSTHFRRATESTDTLTTLIH